MYNTINFECFLLLLKLLSNIASKDFSGNIFSTPTIISIAIEVST